jgi:hypothetical protein
MNAAPCQLASVGASIEQANANMSSPARQAASDLWQQERHCSRTHL